jgi:hypothetical protein
MLGIISMLWKVLSRRTNTTKADLNLCRRSWRQALLHGTFTRLTPGWSIASITLRKLRLECIERESQADQEFIALAQDFIKRVAQVRGDASAREDAFRAFLNSDKDLQPAFHNNGVVEAYERSLERESQADQEFIAFAKGLYKDSMTRVAQVRGDASEREDAFRAFLNSDKDLQPAFHNNGVVEAYERSLERESQADQGFIAFPKGLYKDSMTRVAQVRGDASAREDDFRAFLNSGTDLQPAFHDHQ